MSNLKALKYDESLKIMMNVPKEHRYYSYQSYIQKLLYILARNVRNLF